MPTWANSGSVNRAVRNQPAARGPAAAGEIVQDHTTIVLTDMRELRAAGGRSPSPRHPGPWSEAGR